MRKLFTCFVLLSLLLAPAVDACIVIGEEPGQPLIGRNFDYPLGGEDGYGMLLHNPKGYLRQTMRINDDDQPLTWKSKHASISLNLLSPGTPQDGMNDEGLVATMTVIRSRFHKTIADRSLPSINEMEFLQYILDQAGTVEEAVRLIIDHPEELVDGALITDAPAKLRLTKASRLRNSNGEVNFHWCVADRNGRVAEIDYIDTHFEVRIEHVTDLVMCNEDTDILQVKYSRVVEEMLPVPQQIVSNNASMRYFNARFYKKFPDRLHASAAKRPISIIGKGVTSDRHELLQDKMYHLDRTTATEWNKWQVVYLPQEKTFYYRTKAAKKLKEVRVGELTEALVGRRTSVGVDLHAAFTRPVDPTHFTVLDPSETIADVFTMMDQSPKLYGVVTEHFRFHEEANEASMAMAEFRRQQAERNIMALAPLTEASPSKWSKAKVYGKVAAAKVYRYLAGSER